MHYKNGREAKPGDRVVNLPAGISGVLYSVNGGASCNGRLANITQNDPYITINECLHLEDINHANVPIHHKP